MFLVLTAYIDESYQDNVLMCVGGWLCRDDIWDRINARWTARLAYENRKSEKKGLKSISRYKASDLESQWGEYKGWGKDRSILLTKKMIEILGSGKKDRLHKPIGFACGLKIPSIPNVLLNRESVYKTHWAAYRLCMLQNLLSLADVMAKAFPDERATVLYDQGPFGSAAQSAFTSFKRTSKAAKTEYIVTAAPMDGKTCVSLEPADLLAFEGRKLVGADNRQPQHFRRSLRKVIGNGNFLTVLEITKDALDGIIEGRRQAPPLELPI